MALGLEMGWDGSAHTEARRGQGHHKQARSELVHTHLQ